MIQRFCNATLQAATITMVCCFAFAHTVPVLASEIYIGPSALQRLVTNALFRDGKWHLQDGRCYAFLERPAVSLTSDRLVLRAHLSAKLGFEVFGECVGASFASNVQLSGRLSASSSTIGVDDIAIDSIDDSATRQVVDLLRSVSGNALPEALAIDLVGLLRPSKIGDTGVTVAVVDLQVTRIIARDGGLVVTFEIALEGG